MAVVEIELADLWDRVIEHVSLGEPQHRAFLTMTKPLGLIQSDGGITNLLVAAPNVFAKDGLESRLRVLVNKVIPSEIGEKTNNDSAGRGVTRTGRSSSAVSCCSSGTNQTW